MSGVAQPGLRHWKILNGAPSQLDRLRGTPSPGAVAVDGRSIPQLVAFAARYGALIRFYDLEDKPDGDWAVFFAADAAAMAAAHAALDLDDVAQGLRAVLADMRDAAGRHVLDRAQRRVFGAILRLLCILDHLVPDGGDVEAQLARFARAERHDGVAEPLRRLHRHWAGGRRDGDADGPEMLGEPHHHRRHRDDDEGRPERDRLVDIMEELAVSLIAELARGMAAAAEATMVSLRSAGHAPQAALWNAFVVLFGEARHALNRFPSRLLNFYYGTVLKQDSRAAAPDAVFLTFALAQGATQASVPKGALFSAGTDSQGQAICYATASALLVGGPMVTGLGVHRVTYDPSSSDAVPDQPTGVLSGTVAMDAGGVMAPFPLFGADRPGSFGALTMRPASLGFVVVSPALTLNGGQRNVQITLAAQVPPVHAAAMAVGGVSSAGAASAVLADLVRPAFMLWYSTAGGWVTVQDPVVTPGPMVAGRAASVLLSFQLPPDAPPLLPVAAKPAPGASPPSLPASTFPGITDRPAVIAQLRPDPGTDTAQSPYVILSQIDVATITVNVTVQDLAPASLSGPSGPIDPKQSFPVFGLTPAQNSALDLSAPELFVKALSSLSLSIQWVALPVTSTGFQGYYQAYVLDADGNAPPLPLFDNTSFKVAFSVVSPGLWTVDPSTELYLFQTPGDQPSGLVPAAPVAPSSLLVAAGIASQAAPLYYNLTSSKLRLSLTEPLYAFGNTLYASNLLAASTKNAATLQKSALQHSTKVAGAKAGADPPAPGAAVSSAAPQIAHAASVNATAPDKTYVPTLQKPLTQVAAALNGQVLAALQQAVAGSTATAATKSVLAKDLKAAVSDRSGQGAGSVWSRLRALFADLDPAGVTANLKAWLAAHKAELAADGGAVLQFAEAALSEAGKLAAMLAAASGQAPGVVRPLVGAALQRAAALVHGGSDRETAAAPMLLPNPPWLPMASSLTVNYTAAAVVAVLTQPVGAANAMALASVAPHQPVPGTGDAFLHLSPFHQVSAAGPGLMAAHLGTATHASGAMMMAAVPPPATPLLPPVAGQAALYIDLSAPADQITLLFVMSAGPDGWSTEPSTVAWQKQVGSAWYGIAVLSDTTNGLRNTGIVTLQIAVAPPAASPASILSGGVDPPVEAWSPTLRAVLVSGLAETPLVSSVTANAVAARWVGPGGAASLGTPLPAGTIKQSVASIDGIGTIAQPMQSVGGYPPAVGAPFQMWMAERLRHKGFAIDSWDYARLVLAAVPSLWQLAVVPATDEATGDTAPGQVWLVAVAGPTTPNIADPTTPLVDPAVLAEIGEVLRGVISPFATLTVTNPPYLRLTVVADLVFTDADTSAFWIARLQGELIRFLSPWPDDALGSRPDDYYSRQSVAEFVRGRDYVLGITALRVVPQRDPDLGGWHYLTSAAEHMLTGKTQTDAAALAAVAVPA